MWTSLRVAASAMQAQQRAIEVAANNMNNFQSTGYKRQRANLVDLKPEQLVFGIPDGQGGTTLDRREVSPGVKVGAVFADFTTGPISPTGEPLDIAIDGAGFLQVSLPNGQVAYTRDGSLRLDPSRRLVTSQGAPLFPEITLPADALEPQIAADGTVTARFPDDERRTIGQIQLARVTNPDGLESIGMSLLVPTDTSGQTVAVTPGTEGLGTLRSGNVEGSNVEISMEHLRVLSAQRAYQLSVRAMKTIDEMIAGAANLRR